MSRPPFTVGLRSPRIVRVSAPPEGLLALPFFRMINSGVFIEENIRLKFVPWKNQEQLRAIVLSEKADFIGIHTVGAATMHNRGVPLKMLGLSLGNVLYVLTTSSEIHQLSDLQGKTVAVPFKGELPDILFRSLIRKKSNIQIRYVATSQDGANLLAAGRVGAALVAEPHASILLAKAGRNGIPKMFRSINLQDAWNEIRGVKGPIPSAGVVAIGSSLLDKKFLERFWEEYANAVNWCTEHPHEAAKLLESVGSEKGIEQSIVSSFTTPKTTRTTRATIEDFLNLLQEANPKQFGKIIPSDEFYWSKPCDLAP